MRGLPRTTTVSILEPRRGVMMNFRAARISRWLAGSLLVSFGVANPQSPQRAVIDKYCVSCHNDKLKTGGLALNTVGDNVGEHTEIWEKVVRKLRARYMPPAGLPRPDESAYDG